MTKKIILLSILTTTVFAANIVERKNWQVSGKNKISSFKPSNLKYFHFYDNLPDEISLKAFDNKNLSNFKNKHIVVGYGIVDAKGNNCKEYPPSVTGYAKPVTICLPWWRVERTYQKKWSNSNDVGNFFKSLPRPKAPINVSYCKQWEEGATYPGGIVTCTEYFDKMISDDCYKNPKQGKCFVSNCANYTHSKCEFKGMSLGAVDTEQWGHAEAGADTVKQTVSKVGLKTKQYLCPAGKIIPHTVCKNETNALMYPYTCKEDDKTTVKDDGEYIYCDKNKPSYDNNGNIIGFIGKCSSGKDVMCKIDTISQKSKKCIKEITETNTILSDKETLSTRNYDEFEVNIDSNEPDIYSANPNCLRENTVQEARNGVFQARIVGDGKLDDDIFILQHSDNGTFDKIYCNQQHNGSSPSKIVDGQKLSCIANDGSYSFDKVVNINANNIVSVQEATEREVVDRTWFKGGRTNYYSTEVRIDNVLVAPETGPANYPHYPKAHSDYLRTWENTLATLSLLFPFSGAYEIYFYNNSGILMASTIIGDKDFKAMGQNGNLELKLTNSMKVLKGKNKCLNDSFTEWGGGIFGGKGSINGEDCPIPSDTYVKANPVTNIIIKDLLTGSVTKVPLVYPIAYPNRVFISKLKLKEKRKYRCYKPFNIKQPE